jgi:hypothetical protein
MGFGTEAWGRGCFDGAGRSVASRLRDVVGFTPFRTLGCFARGERAFFTTLKGRRAATAGLRFALDLVFLDFWMLMEAPLG